MNRIIPGPFVPLICQLMIGFGAHAAGTEQQPTSPAPESGPRNENGLGEEINVLGPARLPEGRTSADGLTVQVIDARDIRASGARTFQEALQRIPGIHLADEQGNIRQEDLSLRGFSASPVTGVPQGISVFVDGVRVNEPAAEEVAFELIPLEDIDRIEIVRGPNAIFGRNTLGGAIHILTRRGGREPEASVQIEGGSWNYQEARGVISGPLGPLSGYLSLSEFSDQGWRVRGAGSGVRAFGKLGASQEGASATLSYQFQVDRLHQPGSLPQATLGTDRRENYTPGDFFAPALHFVTLNGRARLASGLSASVNGFFRSVDAEQFNASWISPDTRLFNRTSSAGGTLQLDHRIRAGALQNRLSAGAEAMRSAVRLRIHEEANPRFTTTEDGKPLPRLTSDLYDRQWALGAFLQEQAQIVDGPLTGLAATAALRFDRIAHDIADTSPDAPGNATGNAIFSAWIPAAGVSWTIAPHWLVSTSWTAGFRAPAFLELTCADPAAPCVGLQAGLGPDPTLTSLRPVRSRSLEAGVSGSPFAGLTATLTAFRADLRDDIYSVVAPGTTRVYFQNVGETRRMGLETALRLEQGAFEVEAGYAYTRATFRGNFTLATPRTPDGTETVRPGAQLPLTPNHHLRLEARAQALEWLMLSAGFDYVGSQYFRGDEANVAPKVAPYLILRTGAEAHWRAWTATLRAVNVLDARYETFGAFAPDGRAPGRPIEPFLTPGAPIRVVLGLRWDLERNGTGRPPQ
jgi:iron complex outermembrane receptor protein